MRSVKQLTMYLWDDSRLTASGNRQVIGALGKLLFRRRGDPGATATAGIGPPGRIGGTRGSGESKRGTATPCTSRAGRLRDQPGGSAAPCVATGQGAGLSLAWGPRGDDR
jgi:hypothetical protein